MTIQSIDPGAWRLDAPYKGLAPFTEDDAPFFFGRSVERNVLLANLRSTRLTLLYGASGVGKSSLLQAGFVPYIQALARENLRRDGAPELAVATVSGWRDDPRHRIQDAIAAAVSEAWARPLDEPIEDRSLVETLNLWSTRLDGMLFLLFDQFEEYLARRDAGLDDELAEAFHRDDARVSFLLSVQEEAFARLDRFAVRVPQLFSNSIRLEHLDRDAARDAIVLPIETWNRAGRLSDENAYRVEDGLVDTILSHPQLGTQRATSRIETAYLQLILRRTWDEEMRQGSRILRLSTLTRLGGPSKIVETHVDDVLAAVSREDRTTTAEVLRFLVAPFGERERVTPARLSFLSGLEPAIVDKTISQLSSGTVRILRRTVDPHHEAQYEVFHDLLIPALYQWVESVQKDVTEEKLRSQRRAAERERRKSYILSLALVLALLALTVAGFSYYRSRVESARAESKERNATARTLELQAVQLRDEHFDLSILLGVQAYDIDRDAQALDRLRESLSSNAALGTFVGWAAGGIESAMFMPDGKSVAVATDSELRILSDFGTRGVTAFRSPVDTDRVAHVAFSRDRPTLAVLGRDGVVRTWSIDRSGPFPGDTIGGTNPRLSTIAISSNAQLIATGGADRTIHIWSVTEKRRIGQISLSMTGSVEALDFSPDGQTLAVGGSDGTVALLPIPGAPLILRLSGPAVHCVAFSSDGRMIAAGGAGGVVDVWSVFTQARQLPTLETNGGAIRSIGFDPSSQIVAAGNDDGTLRLWSVFSGELLGPPRQGHTKRMGCIVFAPDGHSIISGQDDGSIRRWEVLAPDDATRHEQMLGSSSIRQRACAVANRNFSNDEWRRFLGASTPYQITCPAFRPGPRAVMVP